MYAVSHAATALPIQRRFPQVGLWPLLIAVQAIELVWVVFTYTGIEHIVFSDGRIHLGYLPYSHSVASTLALAAVAWAIVRARTGDPRVAAAIAVGIVSHIVLDIVQHETDVPLFPSAWGPRLGLGLTLHPLANAVIEFAYGIACWQLFGGRLALLAGILLLNALDVPFMVAGADAAVAVARHPSILTTVVLVQIVVSWTVVWALARTRSGQFVRPDQ